VRSDEDRTIIGFVRKTELRYALGEHRIMPYEIASQLNQVCAVDRARRTRNLSPNATCTFECKNDETEDGYAGAKRPDIVIPGRQISYSSSTMLGRSPSIGGTRSPNVDTGTRERLPSQPGVVAEQVDFGQYVEEVR
jgi:chloride channel 3/4/5